MTAQLIMVNLDCADPQGLAAFYGSVLDWPVTHSTEEYGMVSDGHTSIGFGRVADYTPPAWPDSPGTKRFHLDLSVPDLDAAVDTCVGLGATVPEFQPGGGRWRVLLDPAGHPFCLCRAS
ncbi:VOC family protein [Pseudonocardiaceae bacterium YIM PH 21723]|nr:VOC family protein [Pseudonocardiaceae bacterium YIM PH 21723]